MIRTNFYLPAAQRTALKALSKRSDLSASEHVRRAIDAYLAALKGTTP